MRHGTVIFVIDDDPFDQGRFVAVMSTHYQIMWNPSVTIEMAAQDFKNVASAIEIITEEPVTITTILNFKFLASRLNGTRSPAQCIFELFLGLVLKSGVVLGHMCQDETKEW